MKGLIIGFPMFSLKKALFETLKKSPHQTVIQVHAGKNRNPTNWGLPYCDPPIESQPELQGEPVGSLRMPSVEGEFTNPRCAECMGLFTYHERWEKARIQGEM